MTTSPESASVARRVRWVERYNEQPLADVLAQFRRRREEIVARLDRTQAEQFARVALHQRLAQPMRLVDMLDFQAQHDDYHLATITELLRRFAE